MKYPQLVHMPGDVEHWLEKQLEIHGIDGFTCAKYVLGLLVQVNTSSPMECFSNSSQSYDTSGNRRCRQAYCNRQTRDVESIKRSGVVHGRMSLHEKSNVEKFVEELCVILKEVENNGTSLFDASMNFANELSQTSAPFVYSDAMLGKSLIDMNETQPIPSCNPMWTRGLLHDSQPVKDQNKMEDYFSSLFHENPSDNLGFEFTQLKSDERQDGKEHHRISFYNRQNLLASECTERLYERNTDIDKLIAKFDSNIEGIWKPPYQSEELGNFKYETLFSENLLTNPCSQNGLVWSFDQNGNDFVSNEKLDKCARENAENYKTKYSAWSKFSSPVITSSSNFKFNDMINSMNLTLSSVQKWSSMDGQNNDKNVFLNHRSHGSCFAEVVPKPNHLGMNPSLHSIISHEKSKVNCDEEDLLTSAKTHFRPIRTEEAQASQTVAYADGTTFPISNELEKVTFTRSNSGVLYLQSESELETPRKYMEYKEREISARMFDSEIDLSLMEEFVPKFRVRQSNEKCCQTEDVIEDDQIVPSLNETDCDSDSYECDPDEFFFPGDSELAENIVNKIDDDSKFEFRMINPDYNYNEIYVRKNIGMDVLQNMSNAGECMCSKGKAWLPSNEFDVRQEWSDIWCQQNTCETCKCKSEGLPIKDEYFRFREELTEEGEQLLSDLSCLQQIYSSSKWGDDESGTASDINDDDNTDMFCSMELFNKFKSSNELSWKNIWLRSNDLPKSNPHENVVQMEEQLNATDINLSNKLNELRETPCILDKSHKERKRRNSTSQKLSSFHGDGHCYQAHYSLSSCDPNNSHPFPADVSLQAGESYEMSKILKRPLSF